MPYIDPLRRPTVAKNLYEIFNPGELNYSLTLVMLDAFKRYPKYDTIHCLKRDFVTDPKNNKALQALRKELADRFSVADIYAAAACAYDEFYARVGTFYERKKREENGDLPEFEEVLKGIQHGFNDQAGTVDSGSSHAGNNSEPSVHGHDVEIPTGAATGAGAPSGQPDAPQARAL